MSILRKFGADTRGATSIEYALIVGLIFLAIVTGVTAIGPLVSAKLASVLPGLR